MNDGHLSFVYDEDSRETLVYYWPGPNAEKTLLGVPTPAESQSSKALYAWAKTRMLLLGISEADFNVQVNMGAKIVRPVSAVTLFGGKE